MARTSRIATSLLALGFYQVPSLDPKHFQHRDRVGYLLLLQTKKKLCYQLHTINAYRCLETARNAVFGFYADRAQDLKAALQASQIDDWEVHFRPTQAYPGFSQTIEGLLRGYKSLNTRRPKEDPTTLMWAYDVYHPGTERKFTITSKQPLPNEQVVAAFLKKWRKALDAALNRRSIDLPTYYAGCNELAGASKDWMSNDLSEFLVLEVQAVSGRKRAEVVRHASLDNHRNSTNYRKNLNT